MKKFLVVIVCSIILLLSFTSLRAAIDPIEDGVTILLDNNALYTTIKCRNGGDLIIDKGEDGMIVVRCKLSQHIIYLPSVLR